MSDDSDFQSLKLPRDEGGPIFDEPWHAQVFAVTVELSKQGKFSWSEWAECFSDEIKAAPAKEGETVNQAYYRQWATALIEMTEARGLIPKGDVVERTEEWRRAYLNTPHGQPVLLMNAACLPSHNDHGDDHHDHDHDHDHGHHHHHHHSHTPKREPVMVSPAVR
ncbi:nitrile hydratase accessory protein [Agrobacterium sp. NPDC090283]|uniref:nitrile hydratase accessory protein n=1 Tax=Agrobacterium sp. NPDC090283 TaxID=3363920 RepID=UPI00383BA98B